MPQSRRVRRLIALGIGAAIAAAIGGMPVGAAADAAPPSKVISNYEKSSKNRLERDCGFSHPLPNDGRLSIWLFCDTPIANSSGEGIGFIPGSTAAVGPFTRGEVPTDLSEIPHVGTRIERLPSNQNPQQFLDTPKGVTLPGGKNPCRLIRGVQYPATWMSGVARIPSTSRLLISFTDVCVVVGRSITTEHFGLAEYEPATNTITSMTRVFRAGPGRNLPPRLMLGAPIFSGGHLYLFSHNGSDVFVARTAANPANWQRAGSYRFSTVIFRSTPLGAISADDFSSVGQGFDLVEQTSLGGNFRVWTARSPAGPWTPKMSSSVPCGTGSGFVNFCRALIGHAELSTSNCLLLSFYDPGINHVRVIARRWPGRTGPRC